MIFLKNVLLFFIFILVIYMPFLYLWIWLKNKKGKTYAVKNNAIKVFIKHTKTNDFLSVYTVNGEKPVMYTSWKRYGFYVLPGNNNLKVQYQLFKWNFFRALIPQTNPMATHTEKMENIKVTAEKNKTYELSFDHNIKQCIFMEIEAVSKLTEF